TARAAPQRPAPASCKQPLRGLISVDMIFSFEMTPAYQTCGAVLTVTIQRNMKNAGIGGQPQTGPIVAAHAGIVARQVASHHPLAVLESPFLHGGKTGHRRRGESRGE